MDKFRAVFEMIVLKIKKLTISILMGLQSSYCIGVLYNLLHIPKVD